MGRPRKHPLPDIATAEKDQTAPSGETVTFIGDPRPGSTDPAVPMYGGKAFPKGDAIPVDAAWLKANPRIRKNGHFRVD